MGYAGLYYFWYSSSIQSFVCNKKNLIIVDHFDRWAVLTDKVVSEVKNKEKKITLTIIQHGILTSDFSDYNSTLPFELITKLNNVTDVVVYDELSKKIFLDKILSNDECRFKISPPILDLYSTDSENIKLLFVGHSICLKTHVELYLCLRRKHPEVEFFISHILPKRWMRTHVIWVGEFTISWTIFRMLML